jgi:hypothetical protein
VSLLERLLGSRHPRLLQPEMAFVWLAMRAGGEDDATIHGAGGQGGSCHVGSWQWRIGEDMGSDRPLRKLLVDGACRRFSALS